MSILLIGVNHNDPYGQNKIRQTLLLAGSKGFAPDCIAVEWSSDHAKSVISQRDRFANLLKNHFTGISSMDLQQMRQSLAFEADSHIDLYPDLPILWLDEGRIVDSRIIEKYAEDRAEIIFNAISSNHFSMPRLAFAVMRAAQTPPSPSERDEKFAELIDKTAKNGYSSIACIVGENHADYLTEGMLGRRLLLKRYNVTRYITTADQPVWEPLDFMSV